MSKFLIEPHFRLQEWIAHDKGYFRAEGLDYEFRELIKSTGGKHHDKGDKVGAFQSFEQGRSADVSCACHWTINVAASQGLGRMSRDVYSVAPAGIFVQPDFKIKTPENLAGVPISVGYQSGSHYATMQALEQFMPQDKMNLVYADGMLFARMDKLLDGSASAVHLFSGPYYFAEQLGYRKILDATPDRPAEELGVAQGLRARRARDLHERCDRLAAGRTGREHELPAIGARLGEARPGRRPGSAAPTRSPRRTRRGFRAVLACKHGRSIRRGARARPRASAKANIA